MRVPENSQLSALYPEFPDVLRDLNRTLRLPRLVRRAESMIRRSGFSTQVLGQFRDQPHDTMVAYFPINEERQLSASSETDLLIPQLACIGHLYIIAQRSSTESRANREGASSSDLEQKEGLIDSDPGSTEETKALSASMSLSDIHSYQIIVGSSQLQQPSALLSEMLGSVSCHWCPETTGSWGAVRHVERVLFLGEQATAFTSFLLSSRVEVCPYFSSLWHLAVVKRMRVDNKHFILQHYHKKTSRRSSRNTQNIDVRQYLGNQVRQMFRQEVLDDFSIDSIKTAGTLDQALEIYWGLEFKMEMQAWNTIAPDAAAVYFHDHMRLPCLLMPSLGPIDGYDCGALLSVYPDYRYPIARQLFETVLDVFRTHPGVHDIKIENVVINCTERGGLQVDLIDRGGLYHKEPICSHCTRDILEDVALELNALSWSPEAFAKYQAEMSEAYLVDPVSHVDALNLYLLGITILRFLLNSSSFDILSEYVQDMNKSSCLCMSSEWRYEMDRLWTSNTLYASRWRKEYRENQAQPAQLYLFLMATTLVNPNPKDRPLLSCVSLWFTHYMSLYGRTDAVFDQSVTPLSVHDIYERFSEYIVNLPEPSVPKSARRLHSFPCYNQEGATPLLRQESPPSPAGRSFCLVM